MTNKEYWNRRYLFDKAGNANTGEDFLQEKIVPLYEQAIQETQDSVEKMYQKFANQEDISLAEAKRSIKAADFSKVDFESLAKGQAVEQKEFVKQKDSLPGDIVAGMEQQHMKQESMLAAYTKKGQISRLELIQVEMERTLLDLYDRNQSNIYDFLADQYKNSYYRTVFKGQQAIGFGKDFAALNPKAIEQAVLKTYQRKNYAETLWGHRKQLSEELRTNLTVGLIRGESLPKMASRISKRMEVSRSNAFRLVRTETAYIYEDAARKGYEECGIEKYEFLATLDMRTSSICQSLDGKIFKLKDAMPGKNYPPMHPNCRSTTVAAFENDVVTTRLAKKEDRKYYEVPSDLSYKKWYKQHVSVAREEKADIIKLSDAEQHAINDYISFGAYKLNQKLRDGLVLTAAEREKIKNLDAVLDKCPKYSGNLNRSLFFYDDEAKEVFLADYKVGETITNGEYTSTTKGDIYNPDGQVQIFIQDAKSGSDASIYNSQEQEVVYKRGQKFKVKNSKEMDGVTYILVEEV